MKDIAKFNKILEEYENKWFKLGIYSVMDNKSEDILERQYINSFEVELMRKQLLQMYKED